MLKRKLPDFKYEKSLWKKGYLVIGVDEVGRGALAGPLYVGAVCFLPGVFSRENLLGSELAFRRTSEPVAPRSTSESEGSLRRSLAQTSTSRANSLSLKNGLIFLENLGINDSKKLSPAKRIRLAPMIKKHSLAYSVCSVSVTAINRLGIVKATQRAIRKTINKLRDKSYELRGKKLFILADAFYIKYLKGVRLKNQKAIIRGDGKSISIAAASIIAKVERDQNMIKLDHNYPIYFWKKNKGYGTRQHINAIKKFGKSKLHRNLFLRKILQAN